MFTEPSIVAAALIAFIVVLFKPIKNFVFGFLDQKIQAAVKDLEQAENLRNEAQAYLDLARQKLDESEKTALAIIEKARVKSEQIIASVEREVNQIAERRALEATARINQQERQISEELKLEAVELAMNHVRETLIRELDKDAQMSLITKSLGRAGKLKH